MENLKNALQFLFRTAGVGREQMSKTDPDRLRYTSMLDCAFNRTLPSLVGYLQDR